MIDITTVKNELRKQVLHDRAYAIGENMPEFYEMSNTATMDYSKWLNSRNSIELIKEFIGSHTGHYLNTSSVHLTVPDGDSYDIKHAITEFIGDPNGDHYTKTLSHMDLLKIVGEAIAVVS